MIGLLALPQVPEVVLPPQTREVLGWVLLGGGAGLVLAGWKIYRLLVFLSGMPPGLLAGALAGAIFGRGEMSGIILGALLGGMLTGAWALAMEKAAVFWMGFMVGFAVTAGVLIYNSAFHPMGPFIGALIGGFAALALRKIIIVVATSVMGALLAGAGLWLHSPAVQSAWLFSKEGMHKVGPWLMGTAALGILVQTGLVTALAKLAASSSGRPRQAEPSTPKIQKVTPESRAQLSVSRAVGQGGPRFIESSQDCPASPIAGANPLPLPRKHGQRRPMVLACGVSMERIPRMIPLDYSRPIIVGRAHAQAAGVANFVGLPDDTRSFVSRRQAEIGFDEKTASWWVKNLSDSISIQVDSRTVGPGEQMAMRSMFGLKLHTTGSGVLPVSWMLVDGE